MISKDLVAASATPLVLSILAEGESYGYAILQRVRELSDGEMEWTDGMLYPVLHRLERQGLLTSRWVELEQPKAHMDPVRRGGRAETRGDHEDRGRYDHGSGDSATHLGTFPPSPAGPSDPAAAAPA